MTRLQKCELLKSKGYTYNPENGKIFGVHGKEIINILNGYIHINTRNIKHLQGHHFAWYMTYGNVDFEMLDHINQDKLDNRINNLRIATSQLNQHNRLKTTKGYYWNEKRKKYGVRIKLNSKEIWIGYYSTQEEASNAYLEAKKIYHIL